MGGHTCSALSQSLSRSSCWPIPVPAAAPAKVSTSPTIPVARLISQTADEAALGNVLNRFYEQYVNKNVEGALSLWSVRSSEYAARKEAMSKLFADSSKIELVRLEVYEVKVNGDEARVQFNVDLNVTDAKTGKRLDDYKDTNRNAYFVREGGQWKLWKSVFAETDLAAALISASSDEEREALLEQNKRLVNKILRQELSNQSVALYDQEEFDRALEAFRVTMKIAERINSKSGIAVTWSNMGKVYASQGNYQLAQEADFKALRLYEELNDRNALASIYNNIGANYFQTGDTRLAMEYYQKSLPLKEAMAREDPTKKKLLLSTLSNIGSIYFRQGNNELAIEYGQRTQRVAEEVGDKRYVALARRRIGDVYNRRQDYAQALSYYEKSLAIAKDIQNKRETAETLHNIGEVYYWQDQYARALGYYRQSLELDKTIGYQSGIASDTDRIADCLLELGEYAKALEMATEALALAKKTGSTDSIALALASVADAYRRLKRFPEAKQAYEEAIAATETLRSQASGDERAKQGFERKLAPYVEMVKLLVSQQQTAEALSYAERMKGRVLLDVLRSGRMEISKAMTPEEREREGQLRATLSTLNSQVLRESRQEQPDKARLEDLKARLQRARLEFEDFENSLYAAHPKLKVQRGEAPAIRVEEAGTLLPDADTALLEYVVSQEGTILFVLTRGKERGAKLNLQAYTIAAGEKELARRAESFRQQIASRDLSFRKEAKELFDLLIKPAYRQLQNTKSLIIVPDRALWNLPFQATLTVRDSYLLEDYAVSYAPSLSVLAEMAKARRKPSGSRGSAPTLLALGNPSVDDKMLQRAGAGLMGEGLEPLPEAEKQVTELSRIYGAPRSKVYTGADATEDRVKAEAGAYSILQLAAHGILDNANPMYSHIVLSQANERNEDGLLEAWEMMNLNLSADMVVLSACETARGRIGAGEGVIGMSWALFIAGSPTTVVSQWKVESAAPRS
jgi:CHAT domain-containing protein/tetratricopeptide (TPR) repeat protein